MTDRLATEVERYGCARPPVAPAGIDVTLYPMLPAVEEPVLGVIGSMHWYPSRAAAERVLRLWPAIRGGVPDARLLVGGWGSDRYLAHHFPLEGAELVGPVERAQDFFSRIAVLLYAPPRGTGMKIKVLEALAYGVPVISNREGLEGLRSDGGRDIVRAERDDEIVRAASALLPDPALRRSLRAAGRARLERDHTPAHVTDQLVNAYDALGLLA
jgi:glycosyltransferase involved in cell wall biosynthesis